MVKPTQTIHRQKAPNCLTVFDHFVGLALKGLTRSFPCLVQQFQSKIVKAFRESILKSIQSKIMKDCVKDRFDTILVSTALFKLRCNLIHSSRQENKFILCKISILKFLSNILKFLSLPFIHSLISNLLGLKAYQAYQTVY